MKQDGFASRFIIKLGSSIILVVINVLIQMMLPRVFEIQEYGTFSYNLNVFTSIVIMANMSTSNALVSKFSKKNDERGLIYFYVLFYLLISVLLNLLMIVVVWSGTLELFFQKQSIVLVFVGLNAAILNKLLVDLVSIYDAMAISRLPAAAQIILKLTICAIVGSYYFWGAMELELFYKIQASLTLLVILVLLKAFIVNHKKVYVEYRHNTIKGYLKDFIVFCKPLVLVSFWSQLTIIIMNWTLINYAGEQGQAMYGIAFQISILIGTFIAPYTELLKREFAIVMNDEYLVQSKLLTALKQMIWLSSYFSIFILLNTESIIIFLFGEKYLAAVLATKIMMLYTIYQSWGQVIGSFLLAIEKTKAYATVTFAGLSGLLVGIFIFQIPNLLFPISLGALGIALNYAVVNFFVTNTSVCYSLKTVHLPYGIIINMQVMAIFICVAFGVVSNWLVKQTLALLALNTLVIIEILLSGTLYTILLMLYLCYNPSKIDINILGLVFKKVE